MLPAPEPHLEYHHFEVGILKRKDIKLREIKRHEPVEIKIDDKLDHTLTMGMASTYKEQHSVFEYLGDSHGCRRLNPSHPACIKNHHTNRKAIDLAKPLW